MAEKSWHSKKIAETDHPVLESIRKRWSPRAFSNQEVSTEKLKSLFEAARWAPSSFNEQPWSFIVANKGEAHYQKLFECMVEGNQKWAGPAPVLGVSVAKKKFDKNGKENRHYFHDVGMAMYNLIIQAISFDLYVHQMAGFEPEKIVRNFNIPEGFEPVAMFALGYIGDPEQLDEKLKQAEVKPRERKKISEFVFGSDWGDASGLVK